MSATDVARSMPTPGGGILAYLDLGPPDAPAVLLLHGFPTSSHLFRTLIPALAPMLRVVAPDLFGGGRSRPAAADDLGVAGQSAMVTELLDHLGITGAAVVGHGHGGAVARGVAASIRPSAAVLIDAVPVGPWEGDGAMSTAMHPSTARAADADPAAWIGAVLRDGLGHPERSDPSAVATYAEGYVATPDALARASEALSHPASVVDGLAGLDLPSLLLWGEDDPWVPVTEAERQSDALPASALAVLPGCSHFLPEEASPTIVPMIVEYLRGRVLGMRHVHDDRPVTVYLGRRPPPEAEMMDG